MFEITVGIFYIGFVLLYKYFIKKGYRVIWVMYYKKNDCLKILVSTINEGLKIKTIERKEIIEDILNQDYAVANEKYITNINKLKKKYKIA